MLIEPVFLTYCEAAKCPYERNEAAYNFMRRLLSYS